MKIQVNGVYVKKFTVEVVDNGYLVRAGGKILVFPSTDALCKWIQDQDVFRDR